MEFEGGGFFQSSLRSKASSSLSDIDSKEKIKDCCRKVIAFMCTQVGVGGLVVGYTVVGAFAFRYIEQQDKVLQINQYADGCLEDLWEVTSTVNTVDEPLFRSKMDYVLLNYQNHMVELFRKGFRGRSPQDVWSFPAALMFSLSIITMIGYGSMTPKTTWGKALTVVYAVFGIPLYILYFMNMGEVLAGCFRWVYTRLYECSSDHYTDEDRSKRIVVPSRACLWVICGYVLTGTVMFAIWEKWNYLDSVYFCVTSLCKIGFGDLVPGANIQDSKGGSQTKLVINFIYMLIGLGLVAMCYNLMREEIQVKAKEFREDLAQCLEDTRTHVKLRSMLGVITPAFPIRLCGITGYDKRVNDVIYFPPNVLKHVHSTVVFFGGDVQDFSENMQSHRDNKNYVKWNLEDTARILHSHFPNCHIVIIRPSKIELKTFSCYENFVPCGGAGIPEHTPTHYALQHLEKLLQATSEKICSENYLDSLWNTTVEKSSEDVEETATSDENEDKRSPKCSSCWRQNLNLHKTNLILIGFSKGCVVLNQFLYEFHYIKTLTPDDQTMMQIVSQIEDMYWLDGGHSGQKNTWITSRSLLETLTRLGIRVHIHVTPYQISDERRPWLKKEEKTFSELLQKLGAPVSRAKKKSGKKVAAAPLEVKKVEVKKVVNPLFEKRPRNFGIGQDIRPKRDLSRFVKWPKYIRIQRQKAILQKRLKVPPPINQFSQTLDKQTASQLFKVLEKYRPETKLAKQQRLKVRAEAKASKKENKPTKRPITLRAGTNTVTTLVEQKKAQLVVIAHDVDPIELVLFLPALCRKMGVPYCIIKGKARLGLLVRRKTCTSLALTQVDAADRANFTKLLEVIKTNFNDRGDEIRRHWGGGLLGSKSMARIAKIEKAKARELAQKQG
ncbi:hypothetical protein FQA39_LY04861 [Lamprigera yunnana]|nr:hypothetical protein FQA39_LY04861 [Lamprigera yunnana]